METQERAIKNKCIIVQGMAETGHEPIALAIGRDVSVVTKMKRESIEKFATLLAVCNLKVVPENSRFANAEVIEALEVLARTAIDQEYSVVWDEKETDGCKKIEG